MAYNEQQYHSGPSNNPAAAATETGPHTEHREPNLNKRNMPAGQVPASRGGPDAAARFTAAGLDAVYDGRLPGVPRPRSTNGGYPSSTDPGTDDSPMPQPHPAAYPQTGGGNGGNGGNNGGVVAYPPQLTATFLALHNSGYGHLYPASVGRWVDNAGAARLNPLPPPAGGSVGYTSAGGSVAAYMGTTHGAGGDEDLRSQWYVALHLSVRGSDNENNN